MPSWLSLSLLITSSIILSSAQPQKCIQQQTVIPSARQPNHPTDVFIPHGPNGEANGFYLVEAPEGSCCQFWISATSVSINQQLQAGSLIQLRGTITGSCANDNVDWKNVYENTGPGPGVGITFPLFPINTGYPCVVTYQMFHLVYDANSNQLSDSFLIFTVPEIIDSTCGVRRANGTIVTFF